MNRCNLCLIPDTRPDTAFVGGTCSACINYANRPAIDWDSRKAELRRILAEHGNRCIVPSSGGKDSHYQVLTLLELGADVTIVTASTCYLTPIGRANIDNLARYARTIEVTPNRAVRAKLNRLAFELVGDISWPEHVLINCIPFKVANDIGVPLIFYGEAPLREYGSPPGLEDQAVMTKRWITEFGGHLGLRPSDFLGMEGLTERDMEDYLLPDLDGVTAYWLGQFIPWDSVWNAEKARAAGMQWLRPHYGNWWPFENLDNAMTGLHDHLMYRKYGFGRLAAQLSIDIRAGRMTRDEALDICRARDGLYPEIYAGVDTGTVLRWIGMTVDQMQEALNRFTAWELFAGEIEGRPVLKEWA